jgi:hypothetical protein
MGFRASLFLNFIREIHSARYYNPATGRFMSRDPNAGALLNPKYLHKYLYANGDPENGKDPRGRADELEEGQIGTYTDLQTAAKAGRNGLENHHIIPQSLKCLFMITSGKMIAIALTPEVHQFYDTQWNEWWDDLFGSGTKRCSEQIVTVEEVLDAAEAIYEDDPDILEAIHDWFEALAENRPSLF